MGGNRFGAQGETHQGGRENPTGAGISLRSQGVVRHIGIEPSARQIAWQRGSNVRRAERSRQIFGKLAQFRSRHRSDLVQGAVDQRCPGPKQYVAAIPGGGAPNLFRNAAWAAVKSKRAKGAARISKADRAYVELIISVDVAGSCKLLESVFLQNRRIGSIGCLGCRALLNRPA